MRTTSLPFLLLVITLSGSVWAGQLGAPKCTWGPTYWCSDFSTARECFATTHCIQNVWSKLELPPDDDEVCAVCKEMVAEARDTLRSNETREELKEVFEGSCKLIPIKAIANECIKIFDDFVPELVETLASEMNPQIVCATAGLCNSKRIDNLLKNLYAQSTTNMCNTCRSGVQKFTQRIQDSDPRSLKLRFMDLCDELSSFSDACKVTVEDSFDDIHNVLKFNLNDEICDLMGVCSETFETPGVDSSNSEDIECEFCEKVIQHWKDEWTSRTTIEEFKEVLDALCNKLHNTDRINRCLHIVNDYYIPIFNFVSHELDPKVICEIFGLCNMNLDSMFQIREDSSIFTLLMPEGSDNSIVVPKVPLVDAQQSIDSIPMFRANMLEDEDYPYISLQNAERVIQQTPLISLFPASGESQPKVQIIEASSIVENADGTPLVELDSTMVFQVPTSEAQESNDITVSQDEEVLECQLCKDVIIALKSKVNNNTEEEIKEKLEKMCLAFPAIVRDQCKTLVDKYTDEIINGIIRDLSPQEICFKLHLCSKPKEVLVKSVQCTICKKAVEILEHEIKNKKSKDEIRHAIGQLCKKFPFFLKKECKKFVNKYTDKLVDAIFKGLSPDKVCKEIHVCVVKEEPSKMPIKCKICRKAVKILESEIKDKKNEEEIKKDISELCSKFPKGLIHQCKKFVIKYSKQLTIDIMKGLNSTQICEQLELCKPSIVIVKKDNSSDNTAGCALCEYIIGQLDTYLNKKGNRDSIENALESICDMMSSQSSKKKCDEFVDSYINAIIDTFTHGMSPKELCQLIYICQSNNVRRNELSLGPQNQCKICDGIFTEIYEDVLDKEEEIKEALRNVCDAVLSGSDVESCKIMVDTYVSMVISNIMQYDSPDEFCRNFYQCEEDSSEELIPLYHPNEIPPLEMVLSHEYSMASFCVDCIKVINELENSAFTNTSIDFTVRTLQMVCSTFPSPIDTRCEDAIDEIDGDIEGFFSNNPPKSVCKYLRVCPSSLYDQSLKLWDAGIVGGNKCIWGPEYWCQSLVHARTCGTLDHCRNNVWL